MSPSLNNNIKFIQTIEKMIFDIVDFDEKKRYMNPSDNLYITHVQWPFKAYQLFSKVSGINAFPDKSIKNWIQITKNKGKGAKKRIGLFYRMPFIKKVNLPIYADVYFNKDYFGVLLYINQSVTKVIKFNQSTDNEVCNKILNEANALRFANSIQHERVKTPNLLSLNAKDSLCFFEQELILAKDLHALPKSIQSIIYNQVFDFMFLIYQQEGIHLISPKIEASDIAPVVENYLIKIDNGQNIISKYKSLISENKLMLSGRIHGDLIFNNILFDKKEDKIWLIDWGESAHDYLAKDFKNSIESSALIFKKIINHFSFDEQKLYNLQDQIFMACYDTISRLIENHLIKEKIDSHFHSKIQSNINMMINL